MRPVVALKPLMRLSHDSPMRAAVKITVVLAVVMLAIAAKQIAPVLSLHHAGPAADVAIGLDETPRTTGPLPPATVETYI
jgi:DMSO/TMAO reductase YedYZ molybdopterin-dependent catalytic subunit